MAIQDLRATSLWKIGPSLHVRIVMLILSTTEDQIKGCSPRSSIQTQVMVEVHPAHFMAIGSIFVLYGNRINGITMQGIDSKS